LFNASATNPLSESISKNIIKENSITLFELYIQTVRGRTEESGVVIPKMLHLSATTTTSIVGGPFTHHLLKGYASETITDSNFIKFIKS
jgi:hypothetical protein